MKDVFIIPAINQYLDPTSINKLNAAAKRKGTTLPIEAVKKITLKSIFEILKMKNPSSNGIQKHICQAVTDVINNKKSLFTGTISPDTWCKIQSVFNLASDVVHGKRYEANQILDSSRDVFDALSSFFANGGGW